MSTLIVPEVLSATIPLSTQGINTVTNTRKAIKNILNGEDDRLVVIVGPCSIHDPDSAIRYAEKLKQQIQKHGDTLCIIMRTYIEKARTSIGWKGLVNDPALNNTFQINDGLQTARSLLSTINTMGVPVGTEILNPFIATYFSDLCSWAAIGARTTESQLHREFASSQPLAIGFKNNTNGDIQVAIDAVQTARESHHFLGLDASGKVAVMQSTGNPLCHVILRGSHHGTNYDTQTVSHTSDTLKKLHLIDQVMIDCSHGNSQRDYQRQLSVIRDISQNIAQNNSSIFGVMIESHLMPGKQAWTPHEPMRGEQSITDACIGWEDTEIALDLLSHAVQSARKNMLT